MMDEFLYPNFRQEVIDGISSNPGSPHWITSFQFRLKGKRKDDLVAFWVGKDGQQSEILYYENPQNLDFDEGIEDESILTKWNRLSLQSLKQPSSCTNADITGNGLNDLIVTCEYGSSVDDMDPYGGRICWLENFGTNEGDWACHEIGRFPGVNCIKVGHFSTTFSLQLLALAKSSRSDAYSPLVIFTRPPDVYKSRHWLVSTALDNQFSAIQDVLTIPSTGVALNDILISSREGLTIAWYQRRSWQYKPLDCTDLPDDYQPGRLCAGRIGRDPVAFIVCSEANSGCKLSILSKDLTVAKHCEIRDSTWTYLLIDNVSDEQGSYILDILCEDLDGDGIDEIIVSVFSKGEIAGVYSYAYNGESFTKFKLSDEPAAKLTSGHFRQKSKADLALLSCSHPCKVIALHHSFITSQIKPSIEDSELIFSIPRLATSISEIDVIDVTGYTVSLVILPPNASYDVAPDGGEAVKVLHGLLGWIDFQSEVIERTRVACGPNCVTPMLVDSPEGLVRSGNDGAVFVRMRPSNATDAVHLTAMNILPAYFPCDVRDFEFSWRRAEHRNKRRTAGVGPSDDLFHLPGFRVRSIGSASAKATEVFEVDVARVQFLAAAPGSSTGFVKDALTASISMARLENRRYGPRRQTNYNIHACLSNPSGDGGLLYCEDYLDMTPPTSYQITRARKMILPVLYEHGPFWRSVKKARDVTSAIEYPWHCWVTGRSNNRLKGGAKWNVWAAFDLPVFEESQQPQSDDDFCIMS